MSHPRYKNRHRSGMALMLVIPAIAVATVLAYAVLANTGTQSQISENSALLAQTDCMAESGINYAMYNLQNPAYAPTHAGNYWPGTANSFISLGGSTGTVQISVTDQGTGRYLVTSLAKAASPSNITRTMNAYVQLKIPVGQPNQGGGFNGNLTLGSLTALKTPVGTSLIESGTIAVNGISSLLGLVTQNASTAPAPTSTTSLSTYVLNGTTYSAQVLITAPAAGATLGPTTTNPAGIYYYSGAALTLNGVTINGTLYAPSATVTVSGTAANTITAAQNFPALIATKISITTTGKQLTVNGVAFAKSGITGAGGTGSAITVNGSLLIPAAPAIASGFSGTINLNYVANNVNVPNFSTMTQTPTSVKVVNFSLPQ